MKGYKWDANDYACNASAQYDWATELIEKLELQGNESLLDIGCGDGRISAGLAKSLKQGSVVGIDASKEMIAVAKNHYPPSGYSNLSFAQMDARSIRLGKRFDIAFSNAALHWVDDHRAVLAGVRKVLKPGGHLLFQMGGRGNAVEFFDVVETVMASERWGEYYRSFETPYTFNNIDDYTQWLGQHGFEPKRIELIPKIMKHSDREGLKGWFRTTWFPYTDCVPLEGRERFIDEVIESYLATHPLGEDGSTSVAMVRLEVEAVKL